jgi:hypothetical protein
MKNNILKFLLIAVMFNVILLFLLNYVLAFYYWDMWCLDRINGWSGSNRVFTAIVIPVFSIFFTTFPGFWDN